MFLTLKIYGAPIMATRLINQEDVSNACNELVKAGETPTTLRIHKMLGRGSNSTIQKFIKVWRESEEAQNSKVDQLPAVVELPKEFVEEGELLLKKIFKIAEQQNAHKIEQIHQEKDQAVAAAKAETDEAIEYADEIGAENEQLKESIESKDEKIASLEGDIGSLRAKNGQQAEENAEQEAHIATLNEQIEQLANAISELEKGNALLAQERDSSREALLSAQEKHEINITNIKEDHKAIVKDLQFQHEKSTENLIKANDKAVSDLQAANDRAITDLKTANDQTVNTLQKGLEDAQRQRDDLKNELAKSTEKIAEIQALRDSLKEELSSVSEESSKLKKELERLQQEEQVNEQTE